MSNKFIAMWCNEGLECILDVQDLEYIDLLHTLKNGQPHRHQIDHYLTMMKMRARYNGHRHYEIYAFNAADGIVKEDIEGMFEADPQVAAETIRRIGEVIHNDRPQESNIKIR